MAVQTKPKTILRICHINLRSFYPRLSAIKDLAQTHLPDIFSFNETKLITRHKPRLPGYNIIRKDNTRMSGGIAIAFKLELDVQHIPLQNDPQFAILVRINLPNQPPLHLASLYTSPFTRDHCNILQNLFTVYPRLIVTADLNCHHQALGDRITSRGGRSLIRLFRANPNIRHHLTPPTRYPLSIREHPSCPDKLITSSSISDRIRHIRILDDIGSDHIPLLLDVKVQAYNYKSENHPPRTIIDYKNADWDCYSRIIDQTLANIHLTPPSNPQEVENLNRSITNAVLDAKSRAIPSKTVLETKFRYPPHIIDLIKEKRRVRRLILKDPSSTYLHEAYKAVSYKVKQSVLEFKDARVQKVCDKADLDFHNSPKDFWNLVKRLNSPSPNPTPLFVNGQPLTDTVSKAEAFKASLEKIHSIPQDPSFHDGHFQRVNNQILQLTELFSPSLTLPVNLPQHDLTNPISLLEIQAKVPKLKNTAPGPDGISNLLLKKAPRSLLKALSTLYTSVLLLGYSPVSWKHAHVILLAKANKDPRNPDNYRPISLTSPISKLFEKILSGRLHTHLNALNLLPNTQAGFRPGVNMYDQLLRVVSCIQRNSQLHNPTILALMDVHKAFDTVWHNGLRAKLLTLQLPTPIIKWISNFLDNRTAQVRLRGTLSSTFSLRAGVPQGTAISPLLYILYVRDIPAPPLRHLTDTTQGLAQFADDTAFWTSHRIDQVLRRNFIHTIRKYLCYCSLWRIRINATKTQLCYFNFSHKKFRKFQDEPFLIDGNIVPLNKTCIYLGVTLDTTLSFRKHLNKAKKTASTRFQALKYLNFHHQGCSTTTLSRLYTSIIRPVLTYAHPIFTTAKDSYISSLERTERRAMRFAHHLHYRTSNDTLYTHFNFPPLRDFLNQLNQSYAQKAETSLILADFFTEPFNSVPIFSINNMINNNY